MDLNLGDTRLIIREVRFGSSAGFLNTILRRKTYPSLTILCGEPFVLLSRA